MYFGSIRFFKHLIILIIAVLIIVPIVFAVINGINNAKLKKEINELNNVTIPTINNSAKNELNIPSNITVEEIYFALKEKGLLGDDFYDLATQDDKELLVKLYNKYFDANDSDLAYKKLYPDLFVKAPAGNKVSDKTVYLTFDDGPSENTLYILDILDKYKIKATFFMNGSTTEKGKSIMKEVAKRGHSIGVHSSSHDYKKIYASVDAYLDDFYATYKNIYDTTGIKPDIFRFPGGSINNYNSHLYQELIAEMSRRGFRNYDWNVASGDATKGATWTTITNNIKKGIEGKNSAIILMHDSATKDVTVNSLTDIIEYIQNKGYTFDKMDNTVKQVTFSYTD